jgi:ankyrin repeat protein
MYIITDNGVGSISSVFSSGGRTPLHFASDNGHTDTASMLIEKGADIHEKDNNGSTPFHIAAQNGHTERPL